MFLCICNVDDIDERVERPTTFYLFSYLVPFDLLFNAEYILSIDLSIEHEIFKVSISYIIYRLRKEHYYYENIYYRCRRNGMYERGLLKELEELKIKNIELNDIVSRLELGYSKRNCYKLRMIIMT